MIEQERTSEGLLSFLGNVILPRLLREPENLGKYAVATKGDSSCGLMAVVGSKTEAESLADLQAPGIPVLLGEITDKPTQYRWGGSSLRFQKAS